MSFADHLLLTVKVQHNCKQTLGILHHQEGHPLSILWSICLLNCDNERDSILLNRRSLHFGLRFFLEGLAIISRTRLSNNRSVMPLDVLGRTRATLN